MSETCATCRFYHDDTAITGMDGVCRIRAPGAQPHVIPLLGPAGGVSAWSIFPPVNSGMWCGEHKGKPNA